MTDTDLLTAERALVAAVSEMRRAERAGHFDDAEWHNAAQRVRDAADRVDGFGVGGAA